MQGSTPEAGTKPGVLIVDDDPQIRRLLARHLAAEGYEVMLAGHGEEAIYQTSLKHPDLIVLDLAMPVLNGLETLGRLRQWYEEPVIILSATDEERQKIKALDLGADDYITKPFSPAELGARIRSALRRRDRLAIRPASEDSMVTVGDIEVDLGAHVVTKRGQEIHLTRTEFDLLQTLAQQAGKVLTHRKLLQTVWGPEYGGETEYLRTFVKQLRRKLESDPARPRHIKTEPGVGYRLVMS